MKKRIEVKSLKNAKDVLLYCAPAIDFTQHIFCFAVTFNDETVPTYNEYSSIWIFNANQRITSTVRITIPAGKVSCRIEIETDKKSEHIFDAFIIEGVDANDKPVFYEYPEGFLEKYGATV